MESLFQYEGKSRPAKPALAKLAVQEEILEIEEAKFVGFFEELRAKAQGIESIKVDNFRNEPNFEHTR